MGSQPLAENKQILVLKFSEVMKDYKMRSGSYSDLGLSMYVKTRNKIFADFDITTFMIV
jgi:hypothetical protein